MITIKSDTKTKYGCHRAVRNRQALKLLLILAGVGIVMLRPPDSAAGGTEDFDPGLLAEPEITTWSKPRPVQRPKKKASRTSASGEMLVSYLSINDEPEGDIPHDLAFDPDGTTVVVVNRDTDNMTFFDVDSRTITDTISVGDYPVSVAVTPNGRYALSANLFGNTVSVVDMDWRRAVKHVPITGDQPFRVVTTSDSRFAVVGVINDGTDSSFSIIDLHSFEETLSFPSAPQGVIGHWWAGSGIATGEIFSTFVLSPDNSILVLPDRANSRVMLYEPGTGTELAAIEAASYPSGVDISPDSTLAVVSHEGQSRQITLVDLLARNIRAQLSVAENLYWQSIRISPDSRFAIATALNGVLFVDLTSGVTTANLDIGGANGLDISFDKRYLFVSTFYYPRVVDLNSRQIVATLPATPSTKSVTSPVEFRAVGFHLYGGEDLFFFNINGNAALFEGSNASGVLPEGDAPLRIATTSDCSRAVTANATSNNVAVVDLRTESVHSFIPTGERAFDVAVAPDDSLAVVANKFEGTASIIDLTAGTKLMDLEVPNRPVAVEISPDSRRAYVASVSGTNRVHFIDLDGSASRVTSSLIIGQPRGSRNFNGLALSPDGSVLAVCERFNDRVRLIDTTSETTSALVFVGDSPSAMVFSPDGSRVYVANTSSDDVHFVNVAGGFVESVVTDIHFPIGIQVDSTDSYLYVINSNSPRGVHIVEIASASVVGYIPLNISPTAFAFSAKESVLYIATSEPELIRIHAAGPDSFLLEPTAITSPPTDLISCDSRNLLLTAQPGPDGIDIVRMVLFADGFESGDCSGWSERVPPL